MVSVKEYLKDNPLDPVDHPAEYAAAMSAAASRIADEHPDLPPITALIMAQDAISADRATDMLRAGVSFEEALPFVGSYARIGWILDSARRGYVQRATALSLLPQYWSGSDPDDTDPRFLVAWTEAWVANHRTPLYDRPGTALPPGRYLTVYRGQSADDRPGIAWSLSEEVAGRFAKGASVRVAGGVKNPVILKARIHRRLVLAYLVGRGEQEVILNPFQLQTVPATPTPLRTEYTVRRVGGRQVLHRSSCPEALRGSRASATSHDADVLIAAGAEMHECAHDR